MSNGIVPWTWKRKRLPVGKEDQSSITALQRQMNRMLSDFFPGSSVFPTLFSEPFTQLSEKLGAFTPNVNVEKKDKALVVTLEVPGMDEKDIELTLTKEALTIRGERKQQHEEKSEGNWSYTESSYGAFERVVPFGDLEIDEDKVDASAFKGVVTITLPFRPSSQSVAKKVSIKAG